jgi:hypothetical protein
MRSTDFYLAERTMEMNVEEQQREAEAHRLAHQARPQRPEGISQRGRWLMCELGYALVALGARLEAYSLS